MNAMPVIPAQAWIQPLGWTLIQFLWQGTVISALYAIVRGLFRRRMSAQARYVLACGTLALMALTPVSTLLARMTVPVTPAWPVLSADVWGEVLPSLVAVWFAGVGLFSMRLVGGWRATNRLRSTGVRAAHVDWQRRLEDLIRRLGIARPVRLLVSSLVEIPVVVGWWRPVILVPAGALTGLPPAHVEALLAHELAHIRRFDYLVNILQSLAEAVLFYHPAVWWVSDQIRADRELCCDDLAVAASGDVLTYARALAELESRRPAHAQTLAASGGSLIDRIRRLLGQAPRVSHLLPSPGAAGAMCALWLVGIGAAGAHAAPGHPIPPSPITGSSPAEAPPVPTPRPLLSALLFGPVGPAPVPSTVAQQRKPQTPSPAAKPTASLAGVVTAAEGGKPIKRAHVTIAADPPGQARSVLTDDAGHYVFTDLPAGRYTITASKTGYFDAIFGQKTPTHAGTPVPLADGQPLDHVDLRLSKGAVISGLLLDENGDPSPDTQVRAMRYDMRTGEKQLVMQATSETDDRGIYRLHNLPQGTYTIVAVPKLDTDTAPSNGGRAGGGGRGSQPARDSTPEPASDQSPRMDYVAVYYPGTTSAAAASAVTVSLGEEKQGIDFQVQLAPIAKLEGTIAGLDLGQPAGPFDIQFTVTAGRGSALNRSVIGLGTRLSLQLVNADGAPGLPGASGTTTIFGNHFTFGSVAPGRYVINARGSQPNANGGPPLGIWGDLPVVVDGRNQDNLVITMQEGMTISGHLTLDSTTPTTAPNFGLMRLTLALRGGGQVAGGPVNPRAVADASGRFSIPGVVPGTYTWDVAGPGGWTAQSVMVGGKDALDFGLQVQGAETLDDVNVVLTDRTTLVSGTLTDARDRPSSDYTVLVFSADSKYWVPEGRRIQAARPGTDGKFAFRGLPPGDYVMAAVNDIEAGQWYDPALLQQLKASGTPVHVADGGQLTQNLRIAGGR